MGNANFGELKDYSYKRNLVRDYKRNLFKNIFCYGRFKYASTLRKNIFSAAPVKCFFLLFSKTIRIPLFSRSKRRLKIIVQQQHIFKKSFYYGTIRYVSKLHKTVFSGGQVKCVFLYGSNNSGSACSGMTVWHKSKITVWEGHLFKQKFIYGSFGFVSTLRKKLFSGAPVKWIFLYGLNNSDSVVFGNPAFGEIKDHSVRTTPFQKRFLLEKFWICVYRT